VRGLLAKNLLDISSKDIYFSSVVSRKSKTLATLLRSCRITIGLTLREVERRTGISNAYLSQLENGRTINPSPRLLGKLAEAYGYPYFELMEVAGYKPPENDGKLTLEVAKLASALDFEEQREVAAFIKKIISRRTTGQK
jgi:HTH-type transcriptional regulator, competence development regulator